MKIDLQEIAKATPEAPKRDAHDSVGGMHISAIKGVGVSKAQKKIMPILKRALAAINSDRPMDAVKFCLRALDIDENSAIANHTMAVAVEKLGHLSKALDFYTRAWELDPNDGDIYLNLSLVAWKLDMLEAAEKFLRIFLQMKPGNVDGVINLSGVLRDDARFEDAIELLRTAIYTHEGEPTLWNALGTVLLEQNDPQQAMIFYEEALRLRPDFSRAWHNMAYAAGVAGDQEKAIAAGRKALVNPASAEDRETMRYGLGLNLLSVGELAEGWENYAARLHPDYEKSMFFVAECPHLHAREEVKGKTVLLIGEQGLGDEVLFLSCAGDLIRDIGSDGQLKIAVEHRLVPLIARSFPDAEVGGHKTAEVEGRTFRVVDWKTETGPNDGYVPLAQLPGMYRPTLDAYPKRDSFLVPDADRVDELRKQLAAMPAGPKVGISWKSLLMNVSRSKYYSPFDAWKQVLKTPGVTFVNMQYGECAEEIAQVKAELGITIHEFAGLDLKDDLDGVAAAGVALDLTIGPMNATTNLGAACGADVWFLTTGDAWPMLGTKANPWYGQARVFATEHEVGWDAKMAEVAAAVGKLAKAAKAA